MFPVLLLWHVVLLYFVRLDCEADGVGDRRRVAVCISGQISRFLPESTVPFFVVANPDFDYTFFINLQFHLSNHSYVYSTDPHIAFHPTKFVHMHYMEVVRYLHNLFTVGNNSRLASFRNVPPKPLFDWENNVFRRKADRISQYADIQHVILNSYQHQHACYHQIEQYEQLYHHDFDYVIQTREDVVFLQHFNLSFLIDQLNLPPRLENASITRSLAAKSLTDGVPGECDFISKWCLTWGGINMRWQLMTRNASLYMLGKRFEFYEQLYRDSRVTYNPEQFEKAQIDYYGVHLCQWDIDYIPNIVARHVMNDEVCFMRPETIDDCVPRSNKSLVSSRMCHRLNKHLRVRIENP